MASSDPLRDVERYEAYRSALRRAVKGETAPAGERRRRRFERRHDTPRPDGNENPAR